jgi:hypothetical protein
MRERVNVKSPVREYCSPGSVRGAPGNRCPYLDNRRETGKGRPPRQWGRIEIRIPKLETNNWAGARHLHGSGRQHFTEIFLRKGRGICRAWVVTAREKPDSALDKRSRANGTCYLAQSRLISHSLAWVDPPSLWALVVGGSGNV